MVCYLAPVKLSVFLESPIDVVLRPSPYPHLTMTKGHLSEEKDKRICEFGREEKAANTALGIYLKGKRYDQRG